MTYVAVLCVLAVYSMSASQAQDFADETVDVASLELESAQAEERTLISELSLSGFSNSSLEGEFDHGAIQNDDKVPAKLVSVHDKIHQMRQNEQAEAVDRIKIRAALRWQRFGQITPGIYEQDLDDGVHQQGEFSRDFEPNLVSAGEVVLLDAEYRQRLPFLKPGTSPFTVMWDDAQEVQTAAATAFEAVQSNSSRAANSSQALNSAMLPTLLYQFLDPLKQGIYLDEQLVADKLLLHFAHSEGIAGLTKTVSRQFFISQSTTAFLSQLVHRMWSMRKFRATITRKLATAGVNVLSEAECHYLHLRPKLVHRLLELEYVNATTGRWLLSSERGQRSDLSDIPHPTLTHHDIQKRHLGRILAGTHENPTVGVYALQKGVQPDDFTSLEAFQSALKQFWAAKQKQS
jgi:hypothetical protein